MNLQRFDKAESINDLFLRESKSRRSLMLSGLFETLAMFCLFFKSFFQESWSVFSFFYREAVDARRKFHGNDKIKAKP